MDLVPSRLPEKMSTDRADLEGLLVSCVVGHIAGVIRYGDRTGSIGPAPDLGPGRPVPSSVHTAAERGHAG